MPRDVRAELAELIVLSRAAGADPDQVQGGGGNTSVKSADGRSMWVKASGTALVDMDAGRGWAELDLTAAVAVLDEPGLAALPVREREERVLARLQAAVRAPRGARPSVESSLHALLDRVVIHTHPVHLIAFLCARDSRASWRALLGGLADEALYVPYVDPGFGLARALRDEIAAHRQERGRRPRIILLENHGLMAAAGSVEECLALHERVVALGKRWAGGRRVNPVRFERLRADPRSGDAEYPICAGDATAFASADRPEAGRRDAASAARFAHARVRGALLRGGARPTLVREDDSPTAIELLREEVALRSLAAGGAFTPDQICYCATWPLVLEGSSERWGEAVRGWRELHGLDPRVVLAPGLGVFHAAPDLAGLRVVAETHRLAMHAALRTPRAGGPRFLDRSQAGFIEEWEVERYRSGLVQGAEAPLRGRIALLLGDDPPRLEAARAALEGAGAVVVDAGVPMQVVLASFGGLDHVVTAGATHERPPPAALELLREQGAGGRAVLLDGPAGSLPLPEALERSEALTGSEARSPAVPPRPGRSRGA